MDNFVSGETSVLLELTEDMFRMSNINYPGKWLYSLTNNGVAKLCPGNNFQEWKVAAI